MISDFFRHLEVRRTRSALGLVSMPQQFVLALLLLWCGVVVAFNFEQLQQQLSARFGAARLPVLKEWQQTLVAVKNLKEPDKLKRINDYFNKNVTFDDDQSIWEQSDYWATLVETIGQGRGDCEDFAIAKYYSLKEVGVPLAKLRLVYVKAKLEGASGPILQAHMVLAYYPAPNADPLVLDNLVPDIRPASQRTDLHPVFSFNSEAIWTGVAENSAKKAGTGQLSRWQDLLQRARNEGFE